MAENTARPAKGWTKPVLNTLGTLADVANANSVTSVQNPAKS